MKKIIIGFCTSLLLLVFGSQSAFAVVWPNINFASAGFAHPILGDLYYYNWNAMSNPVPPNQPAAYPNHTFLRMVGKLDGRNDGLACDPCSTAHIDAIYDAELPRIQALLANEINRQGVWIVGNEANFYPQIPASLHAYQFKRYRDLIKGLDANAQLGNSGLLFVGWLDVDPTLILPGVQYLTDFLAGLPIGEYPDIYNVHFYPSGNTMEYFNNNVQQNRDVKNYLTSIGEGAKPIWVTEFGTNVSWATNADANLFMDTLVAAFHNENLAQRWFWFIGTFDPAYPEYKALTQNNKATVVGNHYKALAIQYAATPTPTGTPGPTATPTPTSTPGPTATPTPTPVPGMTFSQISVTGITSTQATVNWTTSMLSTSKVIYGLTPGNLNLSTEEDMNLVVTHSQTLTNLNPNTKYSFKAQSRESGVLYSSPIGSFKTSP